MYSYMYINFITCKLIGNNDLLYKKKKTLQKSFHTVHFLMYFFLDMGRWLKKITIKSECIFWVIFLATNYHKATKKL